MDSITKLEDRIVQLATGESGIHAFLLYGPGSAADTLGSRVIKRLACVEHAACGTCRPCIMLKNNAHPDLHTVDRSDDAQALGVDEIRQLIRSISLSTVSSGYSLAWIRNAHTMNRSASNALLKVLEEPPSSTTRIIITCEEPLTLSQTIQSRCVRMRITGDRSVHQFSSDAKKWLSSSSSDRLAHIAAWVRAKKELDDSRPFQVGEHLLLRIDALEEELRNALVSIESGNGHVPEISPARIIAALEDLQEVRYTASINGNIQLAFETLAIGLP